MRDEHACKILTGFLHRDIQVNLSFNKLKPLLQVIKPFSRSWDKVAESFKHDR